MTTNNPESPLKALLEASANSPLSEAEPNSLDELMARVRVTFNTKPLDLTDEDIVSNVTYYRLKRSQYAALARERELNPKTRKKKSTDSTNLSEALDKAINEIEL